MKNIRPELHPLFSCSGFLSADAGNHNRDLYLCLGYHCTLDAPTWIHPAILPNYIISELTVREHCLVASRQALS